MGHTGAGKSSLVKVLMRFYEFQEGDVRVDGRSIRTLDLSQYRRQLGLVPQAPFLCSRGRWRRMCDTAVPEATDVEVETAARQLG